MLQNLIPGKKKGQEDEKCDKEQLSNKTDSLGQKNVSQKRVALVTGGNSGIGQAVAINLAGSGYKVAITGRNKDRLESVWKELMEASPDKLTEDFLVLQVDLEDKSQVETIVEDVIKVLGRLDLLINNAGYMAKKRGIKDPDFFEDFLNVLQVNLHAPTRLSQLAVPYLKETNGVIINVSSIADRVALDTISYSVSKAGLSMLTKCLANALEGKNVRVVGVAPGPVKSNFAAGIELAGYMTSIGRVGECKEIAEFIAFLASNKASFIHGSVLDIDGGCFTKCSGAFRPPKLLRLFQ